MEDVIKRIALKRYKASLSGFVIVILLLCWSVLTDRISEPQAFILGFLTIVVFVPIININKSNSITVHQSYRLFNKVLYKWFGKLGFIISLIIAVRSFFRGMNIFQGFGSNRTNTSLLVESAIYGAGAMTALDGMKDADRIEYAFGRLHQSEPINQSEDPGQKSQEVQ